jgi:3-carboxy-cis,cis-muconate cycloisomerase
MLVAMSQEHERGLGLWQAEWETVPEIFRLASLALASSMEIAEGVVVNASRMTSNLDAMLGLPQSEAVSAALARKIGRSVAHEILREATRQARDKNQNLSDVLKRNSQVTAHLTPETIDRLFQPCEYLGSTKEFIERVLGAPRGQC